MATYTGNPVRVTGTPAILVTGNPVQVAAPHSFYARFSEDGEVTPLRLGLVAEGGIEWLSPPI